MDGRGQLAAKLIASQREASNAWHARPPFMNNLSNYRLPPINSVPADYLADNSGQTVTVLLYTRKNYVYVLYVCVYRSMVMVTPSVISVLV